MATTSEQTRTFLELKQNPDSNQHWDSFINSWSGFFNTIISRKLYAYPSLWEDAKSEAIFKLFKHIGKFNETQEISPWLARIISNVCEDIKTKNEKKIIDKSKLNCSEKQYIDVVSIDDDIFEKLSVKTDPDAEINEMFDCLWECVNTALDKYVKDERKKQAFLLCYRYNYKLREIAAIFRLEQSTVNNWPGMVLRKIAPYVKAEMSALGYGA